MSKKKNKTIFACKECGNEFPKWMGQCPACKSWNSIIEIEDIQSSAKDIISNSIGDNKFSDTGSVPLSEVESREEIRLKTNIKEFDRVLGGGIVQGSMVLLGGDPGIGKSTLLMQVAFIVSKKMKVLYVTGEESSKQVKMRCDRIGVLSGNIFVYSETRLKFIIKEISKIKPDMIVIDSIQTMYKEDTKGVPGNVSQLRECTLDFLNIAKSNNITIFLIGHVTKDGQIAGPRVLEHIVDTVLYFEGEKTGTLKLLRSVKNRFGASDEVGIFRMENEGMMEVSNPSDIMLGEYQFDLIGTTVTSVYEGTRPILVEIQALVSQTYYTMPRRTVDGIDLNKLLKIIAVLEKRLGLVLGNKDVYINVVGGMRINEPAVELSVAVSVYSSLKNLSFPDKTAFVGEIGLSGEVRAVKNINGRLNECIKLGLDRVIIPTKNYKNIDDKLKKAIKIIPCENIKNAVEKGFKV